MSRYEALRQAAYKSISEHEAQRGGCAKLAIAIRGEIRRFLDAPTDKVVFEYVDPALRFSRQTHASMPFLVWREDSWHFGIQIDFDEAEDTNNNVAMLVSVRPGDATIRCFQRDFKYPVGTTEVPSELAPWVHESLERLCARPVERHHRKIGF